ncbi:hypothetical protein FRC03_008845 [Tulasnella sp. 419]|nr:hypothetical protein FRC03_008845 [Tulasnella sp. 419]
MSTLISTLNQLALDPRFSDYLGILKGARNGIVYGVKVRFPHALIMAILFGKGDWKTRAESIFRATKTHALNLARFVSIYKALVLLQKKANGGKEGKADTFIAGLIGGYLVFGERTAINEQVKWSGSDQSFFHHVDIGIFQIVLYVTSRVVASFIPRDPSPQHARTAGRPIPPDSKLFSAFAALTWGAVMWLFKYRPETIQPGMWSSMTYLYRDSDSWKDLRTLLWHNK